MAYNSKYKSSKIEEILDSVGGKQDVITDLDSIREGASKGATALQEESYKGTVTEIKINGETKSPNFAGVVDLGEIKVDEVKFANDLTGVVEATPEMFTYRPSAGDKSVRDESAVIRRIKGNTSVWGQFADVKKAFTNSNYIITRNDDGSITIKRDPSITSGYWCALNLERVYRNTSHKYMFTADISVSGVQSSADYCQFSVYDLSAATTVGNHNVYRTNGRRFFCCFGTPATTTAWQFAFYVYGIAELTIHTLQCFDLTAIFGAGNEPTTYEEFRQYYPDAYYQYCAPEIRSMRATGIETIGFNAYNGEYAEVIGGQPYYLGGAIDSAHFATEVGGESLEVTIPENRLYTPSENGYIYATGNDICINLSHSGVRNGEYEEYEKNTLLLPEIAKYFPDGMHGIGDVYDEINEEIAIQRCAVRAYEEGDENNAEVKTDKITTVYKLSEPIYTPIDELVQLDYKVDDFGTEKMMSDAPSAPFKADIVYQFNAEGRIRDNSRNIEKLEGLVKQTTENFATKGYVEQQLENVQKGIVDVESSTIGVLEPNKIYVLATKEPASVTINSFSTTDALTEEYVVQFRTFAFAESITLPSGVMWANGVKPALEGNTLYELSIVKTHIGETDYFKAILTSFK